MWIWFTILKIMWQVKGAMRRSRSICPSAEASKAIAQELALLQKEEMEAQIGAMEGLEEKEEDSLSSDEGGLKFASSRVSSRIFYHWMDIH